MSDHQDKIAEGAECFLDDGETITATLRASPRGSGARAGGTAGAIAGSIGQAEKARQVQGAEQVGIRMDGRNMGFALTQSRLLSLKIGSTFWLGKVTEVKKLMSAVPLRDIESIKAKRFGLTGVLTLTARGTRPIKLQGRVRPARAFADAFNRAQSAE